MAAANAKLMRAALKEALELYEHEYTHDDGEMIGSADMHWKPTVGQAWLMRCREALGLNPLTGKRQTKQTED